MEQAVVNQDDRSEAPTTVVNGRIVPADAVDQYGNPYATSFGQKHDQFGNPIATGYTQKTDKFGNPITKEFGPKMDQLGNPIPAGYGKKNFDQDHLSMRGSNLSQLAFGYKGDGME